MYDIDLEKLDKISEKGEESQTLDAVAQEIDGVYRIAPYYQQRMGYIWMQNIHFLLGDQHIYYDSFRNLFYNLPADNQYAYIPRPVTNMIQPAVEAIVSTLTKNKPNADVAANSPDCKDITAARIAAKIQDCKWEDDNEQEKLIETAYWAVCCGTVFRKDYWDSSYGKIVRVPKNIPVERPILDQTGQIQTTVEEKPAYDFNGSPMFDEIPLGDNAVDIIDPFRMLVDPNASNEYTMNWIMESSVHKLFWIRENFDKKLPGYTGEAKNVKEEADVSLLLNFRQSIKGLSGKEFGGYPLSSSSSLSYQLKGVSIVKELYVRPTKNHPKGQMIVSAGGKILYRGPSPYYDGTPESWHPYTIFRYQTIPGRFWGKSMVEDIVEPQRRMNAIDALVIMNRKTMVAPQRLIPHGSGIPNGFWNGAPGLELHYRPVGANGAKPEIIQGIGLPPQIYQEREVTKTELQQIVRLNEVLQGIRPPGVTSGYQYQLQLEQALGTFAPMIHRWEKFIERGQTKKLKLIAHRYREPRREFIDKLRVLNKEISDAEIMNFLGTDLRDNCQVRIEAGSSLPRSIAGQQQMMMDLAKMGLLTEILQDPIGKKQFLDRMGLKGFDVGSEVDVKRAAWENEMMESGNFGNVQVLPFENHAIHIESHSGKVKEPKFKTLPQDVQDFYIAHLAQHQELQQQQEINNAQKQALAQGNLPSNMSQGVDRKVNPDLYSGQQPQEEGPPLQ